MALVEEVVCAVGDDFVHRERFYLMKDELLKANHFSKDYPTRSL